MRFKTRREYMKDYRENYGNLMKAQIKEWFARHPHYLKGYLKRGQFKNPGYYSRYASEWAQKKWSTL